jgi:hypothetical protein
MEGRLFVSLTSRAIGLMALSLNRRRPCRFGTVPFGK